MDDEFFDKLREKAGEYSEDGGSHDFSHTERVYNLALKISENENVDLDIIKSSSLLHDIAREKEDSGKCECHAKEGAKMAEEVLRELNFPEEKISQVSYAIQVHRHSTGINPKTKEAEVLQDADRLDALGAITIARMFSSGGKLGIPLYKPDVPLGVVKPGYDSDSTIHGFHAKILKITPDRFHTKKAREIAEGRYQFVKEFLDRFFKEWEGKL